MQLKKLVILATGIFFNSVILANGDMQIAKPVSNPFNGWYLGLGLGADYISGQVKSEFVDVAGDAQRSYHFDKNFGNTSIATDMFVGYGGVFAESFYLGGEAYFRVLPASFSVSDSSAVAGVPGKTELTAKSYIASGLGIRGGYLFTPVIMAYISVAADGHVMSFYIDHTYAGDCTSDVNLFAGVFNLVPGVGIEAMLTDKLSLRAQYNYYSYGSPSKTTTNYWDSASHSEIKGASGNVFLLDVVYHFNGI